MYCVVEPKVRLALGLTPRPALPALVRTARPVLGAAPKATFPKRSAEFRPTTPMLAPALTLAPEPTLMDGFEGTWTAAPVPTLRVALPRGRAMRIASLQIGRIARVPTCVAFATA